MAPALGVGRIFNAVAALIALVLAIGLYRAKTEADTARARVAALEAQVESARTEIKTLAAELAVLESPARIEALAKARLRLAPVKPSQVRPLSEIGSALPPPERKAR
jgi:cell division protein FtsL